MDKPTCRVCGGGIHSVTAVRERGHVVKSWNHDVYGADHRARFEGYPIVRRFVIKRHPLAFVTKSPWVLRDRSRPAYLGHFATLALAIAAVDRRVALERGEIGYIPSVREIRGAMSLGKRSRAAAPIKLARA